MQRDGDAHARANLIAGRDVEPAFSWGFFDRLLLIVTERVGELVVVFGDQIDIALVLDRGDRRLQRICHRSKNAARSSGLSVDFANEKSKSLKKPGSGPPFTRERSKVRSLVRPPFLICRVPNSHSIILRQSDY
jgi:hypothetical protein